MLLKLLIHIFLIEELKIKGYKVEDDPLLKEDYISNIIYKYRNHPSILRINQNVMNGDTFTFSPSSESEIASKINSLNRNKPSTFNNIPTKILIDTSDISTLFITKIYNNSVISNKCPSSLKLADVTPTYKKDDRTDKTNYRPICILLAISKVFERSIYDHIFEYINKYVSPYLCGLRKGYSTQHC